MITINDIAEATCRGTRQDPKAVATLYKKFVQDVIDALESGNDVQLRGLCTFRWVSREPFTKPVPPSVRRPRGGLVEVPARRVLTATLAEKFQYKYRHRGGNHMSDNDEGMEKYGVQLDDEKIKEASEAKPGTCPNCHSVLDDAGVCPVCGTEPFERRPE
jgi:nucleoid DNA-binding protein